MRYDKKKVVRISGYHGIRILILLFITGAAFAQPPPSSAGRPTVTPPGLSKPEGVSASPPADQMATETRPAATLQPTAQEPSVPQEELVYLNVQAADISDVIRQISKATGRNFIIDDKVKGKVTIISEKPMTREEAYQTFLSALEVAGFTTVKGPAGVIKIVPLKDAVQEPIPTHVDTTPITDSFITRLIPLQNISAVDMSNAIRGLVSKDGNLFAYPSTNTLIITDSGTNIDRLMKIIKELDQEGPQQVLEIIPIQNAAAKDIAQMVNQLFEQQKGVAAPKPATAKKTGELEEMEEVSKVIPDDRTNSIIVLASKRAIEKVRGIIQRLDRRMEEGQEGRIHVYFLKHAKAKDIAETLSTLTAGAGAKPAPKAPGAAQVSSAPVVAEFESGIKVTADEPTNSLVITATPKDYQTLIEKVISKLDVQLRQVYLEAVVMELSINKDRELGTKGFGGGSVGPVRVFGSDPFSGLLSSFLGVGSGTSAVPTLPSGILGGLIGRDSIPITIGNQTRNIPSMGVFFSALSNYGDANVVSTPNILTLDNQEAKIEVKGKRYFYGNQMITAAGSQLSSQSAEAGLILKITPQIGESDNVRLKIDQTLSDFDLSQATNPQLPPPTRERVISTSVVTADGQTVVLGGLMEDRIGNAKSKVPILGDIPIIGILFKNTRVTKSRVNLLVFITPHIVKDATDFNAILKRKIEQRNQFIDENFGRRQQEIIRSSIRSHRQDLLEFKEPVAPTSAVTPEVMQPMPPSAPPPVVSIPRQPAAELGETAAPPAPLPAKTAPVSPPPQQPPPPAQTAPTANAIPPPAPIPPPQPAPIPPASSPVPVSPPSPSATTTTKGRQPTMQPQQSTAQPQRQQSSVQPQQPTVQPPPQVPSDQPAPGARKERMELEY